MSIEEYKELQKKHLERFKRLSADDPERARLEARDNLVAAGIIEEDGRLAAPYR